MRTRCECLLHAAACFGRAFTLCALIVQVTFYTAVSGRAPRIVSAEVTNPPSATPIPAAPHMEMPFTLAALAGEAPSMRFEHLPPEAGLSQSVVLDFAQDDQGFLWLATQDGLNRYDGYEFKIFKDDPQAPNSLKGNFVASIDKAPTGELWIGTSDGGLNRYDPRTGQFTAYLNDPNNANSLSENSVSSLDVDSQGIIWVATNNAGLNRLDPRTGAFTHYLNDPADPKSLSANNVATVLAAPDGSVWVGATGGGLNRLDPATGVFTRYQNDPTNPHSLSDISVTGLYLDRQDTLWVGTFAGGLNRLDPATGAFIRYQNDPADPTSLAHNSVLPIFEDSRSQLWVGTQGGGLHRLDRATGRFTRYQHDPLDPSSLSVDSVSSIFEDSSGILWLGMFGSGADYYDPLKNKFLLLRGASPGSVQADGDPAANSLNSNAIWGILQDDRDNLWVGTNDGGLNRFNFTTGIWKHYLNDPNDPTSLSSNTVYAIYQDRYTESQISQGLGGGDAEREGGAQGGGALWVGTPFGLHRFDRQTETFAFFPTPMLNAIYEDRHGNFWLGTAQGLILFDRATGTAQPLIQNDPQDPTSLSANFVSVIYEDAQDNLWIGTLNGGLNLMDRASARFERFVKDPDDPSTLSNNAVLCLHQAADGTLWIGTVGGLNRYNPSNRTFTAYRQRDGLPNDFIYGILEDEQGGLWLSTNKGLARFDPQTLVVKTYDSSDGLQGSEFDQWAYFQNEEGVMFFGGINGLNAFHPALIQDNPFIPPVVLTGFRLFNQTVPVGPEYPLHQPVEVTQAIQLAHTDDFFEFTYSALHFSSPEEVEYAYQMEGLDTSWNEVGNRRFATYTNVPPGDYTFRVKGTNSDGVWNEHGASLRIVIPPPIWQTLWFRLLVAGIAIAVIFGGFALRIRSVDRQRQQLEVQVAERTHELRETMLVLEGAKNAAEVASRAKSVFLANMSHEFRTPLNAILGFTQIMARDKRLPSDHRHDIEIIHRSGEHLLGLINDVLDMSKIEAGRARLNQRGFELVRLLQGLEEMFALRAEQKGLRLQLELDPAVPRYVTADDGKLRQVLMNLLGNAVKFTTQGQVVLRAERVETYSPSIGSQRHPSGQQEAPSVWVRFAVEDTGPGIHPDEVKQIFTPFVQSSRGSQTPEGTGLGLAISQQYVRLMGGEITVTSQPGDGSIFQFTLPLETISVRDLEQPPLTRRVIGLQPGQPTYRMLVVDDSEVNRKLLVRILEPVGFEIREAGNGAEALQAWEEWQPHLIWMDMRMPVMDGYEATRRIKATTRGMATIIIALTASALEEDRAVILSEGCDDYLRKPFHEEDLFEAAGRHLGVRYVYEELAPAAAFTSVSSADATPVVTAVEEAEALTVRLRSTDPAWRVALERATILGDLDAINQLAGQIVAQAPDLAETIAELARGYEHDRLLTALRGGQSSDEIAEHPLEI